MTKTLRRRIGLLVLLLPLLFITLQSSAQQAQAGTFDRTGMWIWYISSSNGGDLGSIIKQARKAKVRTLYVKSGDGDGTWSQFNKRMVDRFHRAGLKVCGWQYVYGKRPVAEAKVSAAAKRRGADCFVIDAEAEYEGRYAAADLYMRELRKRVGKKFELGLSSFPYVNYHPGFPYSVFLGPGAATGNLPQVYWHTIGDSVKGSLEITWEQNSVYKRKIYPVGQTYENPGARDLLKFRRYSLNFGTAPSWWSWQETNSREWDALAKKVDPIAGYKPYSGHVTLERGNRGDQVVWLQQHLIAAGYDMEPTGIFGGGTYRAVRKFQKSKGLEADGMVGTQTWNRIMRVTPVRVRWSAARSRRLPASVSSTPVPSAPLSADLPAVKNEIAGAKRPPRK